MPVQTADIKLFKSTLGASEGGGASPTQTGDLTKNNLWPDLSDIERSVDGVRYRKVFLGNDSAADTLVQPKAWIFPDVIGFLPTKIGIGPDDTDDDNAAQGNLVALTANAQIELSSSVADTRNATLVGVDATSGDTVTEAVALNGTTPVLSAGTFSKLYAVYLDSESATAAVTIKQGLGGTAIGTIVANRSVSFLWVTAGSEASAVQLPDLIAGARIGIWMQQSWLANPAPQRPADPVLNVKEGS
jgi:hypothetical protein